jgi:predicted nucleotidyltransferase
MGMQKHSIPSEIEARIKVLAKTYGLSLVVLFGSRAEGRDRKGSDVDIAYLRDEKLPFDDEIKLAHEVELLFSAPRADIVYIPSASPFFMYMILQDGVVLFEKNSVVFPEIYTYAVKRFHDNMPLYQMRFDYLCRQYNVT